MQEKEEDFGRNAFVFKNERKLFKRYDFGMQHVEALNLESEFKVQSVLRLDDHVAE